MGAPDRRPFVVIAVGLCLICGCAGQDARGRANGVGDVVKLARNNGAYRCAPKPLALAEAHLTRTHDELDLGNLVPAQRHLALADQFAHEALDKSPPERCASSKPADPEKDRDGDGCLDEVDKCPDQPEDEDGFEDSDCCPDPDNDEDGLADAKDRCPNHPEDADQHEDADGCPEPDNDRDGIADIEDTCPDKPEDYDAYQDQDGCPDEDNDADKIADLNDKCPDEPEDYDGEEDSDGCPDKYKLVTVTKQKIELKQRVFFATGRSKILRRSYPLLDEVALVLKDRPKIHVRIEGHTDSRGGDAYNQQLSEGRATAVRVYLIKRAIDPNRLASVGYGESRPIANNMTRAGRALNRRVEFVITKQ
jgi:outer membrane protein OmpA-like peptidoglycan-associated protein